ncbi:hypothetical protein D9V86_06805 [Bacteroidetes/Chlorobi group bacterium ChocPot_Mid]|nr:MAG: hypothetical protein D9V86_06805 [Bacteroidetes/Chlorobi group bacterium ChocPot_Mid]
MEKTNNIIIQTVKSKVIYIIFATLLSYIFIACSNEENSDNSDYLTLGTFNCEWLGDGVKDINPRTEIDYKNMADIISNLKSDIIGLEEVENNEAIQRLTKYLDDYDYFVGKESGDQNPALLYKKNINVDFIKYIYELEVEPGKTKPGILFQIKKGNFDWLMMVVHLKSTSRYDSTEQLQQLSRELRSKQASALSNWIDSVLTVSKEKDLIIVGDFNDYPNRKTEPTLTALVENPNIEFLSSGLKSCKYDYLNSIDHIIVSKSSKNRYLANSIRMYNFFDSIPLEQAEKISDHCPVVATFNISLHDND